MTSHVHELLVILQLPKILMAEIAISFPYFSMIALVLDTEGYLECFLLIIKQLL